jgi:hypothetical protein
MIAAVKGDGRVLSSSDEFTESIEGFVLTAGDAGRAPVTRLDRNGEGLSKVSASLSVSCPLEIKKISSGLNGIR